MVLYIAEVVFRLCLSMPEKVKLSEVTCRGIKNSSFFLFKLTL